MISNNSKIEFGNGDIKVTGFCSEGLGGVALQNQIPHKIGEAEPVVGQDFTKDANVILTFSKVESIDVLIHHLMFAKNAMLGNIDPTWHKHEEPFDLDSFIK